MTNRDAVYEEDYKGYHIKIIMDEVDESPREWDNLGTMVCWHGRYNLGDEQPKDNYVEFMRGMLRENVYRNRIFIDWLKENNYKYQDGDEEIFLEQSTTNLNLLFSEYYVVLPLYLYDHSGISISYSNNYPYNDRWDAGQVGFIYVSKEKALKEFSRKHWSKAFGLKIIEILKAEVNTYDDYLQGNVYGYQIFDIQEDEEYDGIDCIDSCWGFYPDHKDKNYYDYCLKEARENIDAEIVRINEMKWETHSKDETILGD